MKERAATPEDTPRGARLDEVVCVVIKHLWIEEWNRKYGQSQFDPFSRKRAPDEASETR